MSSISVSFQGGVVALGNVRVRFAPTDRRFFAVLVLVGLTTKRSVPCIYTASRAEGPGFESRLRRDFFWVESYQ